MRGIELRMEIEDRGASKARRLAYNHFIDGLTMDDIVPIRRFAPTNIFEAHEGRLRDERRQRLVDMIAAKIAHALTEAIVNPPPPEPPTGDF